MLLLRDMKVGSEGGAEREAIAKCDLQVALRDAVHKTHEAGDAKGVC